jgi:S-adenosylmethionine-diacylglycerol 3-amino-3-carboxypropyl transferase
MALPDPTLHYAQCWEDADVMLAALDVSPGDQCLSIASAGDNTLALLVRDPAHVIAVDANPAQIAALALRISAYRSLDHGQLLELVGSVPSARRIALFERCASALDPASRRFWEARRDHVAAGIGTAGRFEQYLGRFRRHGLPLVQDRSRVEAVFRAASAQARAAFFDRHWNHWRWRLLFRVAFSRLLLDRFARHPGAFRHVEGDIASHLLARTRHALTVLDPCANPYLQWLLTGRHLTALPLALRPENFAPIRDRLDRLELRCEPLAATLQRLDAGTLDRANLSNVFEYMAPAVFEQQLGRLATVSRRGARLVYWNLLAPRSRPPALAGRLAPDDVLARDLHRQDKAFFYSRLVIERVT